MTRAVLPARRPLSLSQLAFLRGTLWVSGGTAILGLSGYAFLTLAAPHVSAVDYAALASLYLLMALAGPGLFMPVEQETIRLVSQARALGLGTRDTIRQLGQLSAAILGLGLLVLVVLGPFLVRHVFGGHVGLWIALAAVRVRVRRGQPAARSVRRPGRCGPTAPWSGWMGWPG